MQSIIIKISWNGCFEKYCAVCQKFMKATRAYQNSIYNEFKFSFLVLFIIFVILIWYNYKKVHYCFIKVTISL